MKFKACLYRLCQGFNIQDNSGDIENEELSGFLKDLLELVKTVRMY